MRKVLALFDELGWCDIDHRGLLIDLGTDATNGRFGWALATPQTIVQTEHEGATWARIYDNTLTLRFYQPYAARLFVALRATGKDGRRASISIDDSPVGQVAISGRAAKIAATGATRLPVDEGLHELTVHFGGKKGSDAEPYAEIDWIRVAAPDEHTSTYGAPTLFDVRAPASQLGGVPHRAIALRAPTTVACPLRVPGSARFTTSIGMSGAGAATATLSIREDGADPVVLKRQDVKGGDDATWSDIDVSLDAYAGRVVRLELAAVETSGTGRLLFGDPTLLVPERPGADAPRARSVVVVVLDGVERSDLPPWSQDVPHASSLKRLAATATVFDQHRGPATQVNASLASLLTGLSPRSHTLIDPAARLPKSLTTIGDVAREGSVRTAMFTGVPTSFAAFGFDSHWESFHADPPNEGHPATAPIDQAAAWLAEAPEKENEGRPMLAVIHARGGHPPWDLTPAEASKLPPPKYVGALRPRDAARAIANLQGRFSRLAASDEERLRAMYFAGLYGQDAALGKLIHKLEQTGRWDTTLFIVTADVSSALRTLFADNLPLDEAPLTLPLYVHFPGGAHAGQRVSAPTEMTDVTRTVLAALGLKPPPEVGGRDLATVAAGHDDDTHRIRVAYGEDSYSARWERYVLRGRLDGRRPELCDLALDPTCAFDRTALAPIAADALFRRFADVDQRRGSALAREPVALDSATAAMLKVWGL
jgi:arylsulfatase A-like enzyme